MDITVLYNPNSTGDSKAYAQKFRDAFVQADGKKAHKITLLATKHAGHAEEIAAEYAAKTQPHILISSSGDGGYHELINGALAQKSSKLIVGLLPAGNANDHYNALDTTTDETVQNILANTPKTVDVLRISAKIGGKSWVRYAHSYAGIGVVAKAAKDITKERPNLITEKWLVAKSLLSFRYVKIHENGKNRRYSSLIFSNVRVMSKALTLAGNASLTDGKFEINRIRFRSKLRLLTYLLTAATVGLTPSKTATKARFTTTKPTAIQLDGEVVTIDARCNVTIEIMPKKLRYV